MGDWSRRADREDSVRQTVYVSDIDQHVFFFETSACILENKLSCLVIFIFIFSLIC
jgi:hypothetical protein